MRTPEEIKWDRTLQHLLETTRNTDLLHGKDKRLVFREDIQKQFHRVIWTNDLSLNWHCN